MQRQLKLYIASRGAEEFDRLKRRQIEMLSTSITRWQLGVSRTLALLGTPNTGGRTRNGQMPSSLDFELLARLILGSAALFSQLSLCIAHLIAALYNIYKKERFSQVVLAGGVLKGAGGKFVEKQTQAFLAKYYDKMFGPTKHLKAGSIRLAPNAADFDIVAPFGAAMVANRLHKLRSLGVMEKELNATVQKLKPGQIISVRNLVELFATSRAKEEDIQRYIQRQISKSILVQRDNDTFMRVLNTE
jgi:hypothetical protein